MFFKIGVLRNFTILTEKHLCWSLFLLKRDSNTGASCEYCKTQPLISASELKSDISKENLKKSKKKLFLYFDNSHANQTNTTKKT